MKYREGGITDEYVSVYQAGVMCYSDAIIMDDVGFFYLISLFGRPGLVKAVGAGLIEGYTTKINGVSVSRPSSTALQAVTQNLEDGLTQKVIFAPEFFTGQHVRVLVGEDRKSAFRMLDSAVSTPLKEEWADFLFSAVFSPQKLVGFGHVNGQDLSEAGVYLVSLDKTTDEIDALVMEEINLGNLQ